MNVYTEVVTWILCSLKENFAMLNREDDNSAVIIANPRSADFEVPLETFGNLFVNFFNGNTLLIVENCFILCGNRP